MRIERQMHTDIQTDGQGDRQDMVAVKCWCHERCEVIENCETNASTISILMHLYFLGVITDVGEVNQSNWHEVIRFTILTYDSSRVLQK